jgi:transcriptional regulator with XRE-family HTH domain
MAETMAETMGRAVARARASRGATLRTVAGELGISVPYLHDIEHDRRRLPPARWRALVTALPALTLRALAEAAVSAGPVEIDARELTSAQRARLVAALEQTAEATDANR